MNTTIKEELNDITHVYVDGVEIHGVQRAELIRTSAIESAEENFPILTEGIREISMTMEKFHWSFARLLLGMNYITRPPYKRNKHRYGR